MRKISGYQDELNNWNMISEKLTALHDLAQSDDESFRNELVQEIDQLKSELNKLELKTLLSGPYDKGSALLSINAGAGGTDAQDWGEMLMRMYLRWAEQNGYSSQIINKSDGEEAGIKSVTIQIEGNYAYGER